MTSERRKEHILFHNHVLTSERTIGVHGEQIDAQEITIKELVATVKRLEAVVKNQDEVIAQTMCLAEQVGLQRFIVLPLLTFLL